MTLELRKPDSDAIKALWADWKADKYSLLELETTIRRVDLTGFQDTISRLRAVGLKEEPQQPKLNILMPGGLRFTIVGPGLIQEYCHHGDITKVPYSVVLKERRRLQDKPDQVDLADYGARIKVRREVELSKQDARVVKCVQGWAITPKQFRYIKRYTFMGPADLGMRFDLSIIRESARDATGAYKRAETLQIADILNRPLTYEIEAEALRKPDTKVDKSHSGLLTGLVLILQGIQRSFILVRQPTISDILQTVSGATGSPIGKYPGPQPVTINRVNLATEKTEGVANIRYEDYNVTDKADGLRCLLVVARDGRIYLVDSGRNVYGTGLRTDKGDLIGTVLDGEWIKNTKTGKPVSLYYAFDIFTSGTSNVTALPFINSEVAVDRHSIMKGVVESLATADSTIEIPSSHKLKISMKTFHSTSSEPGSIFSDIRNCLDAAKEGDYNTDGLIFTPNLAPLPVGGKTWEAQMKWKPPHENTIDFLVVFEKSDTGPKVKYNEEQKKMVEYKALRLFVAGSLDPLFKDPRDTILSEKELPQALLEDDTYRPIQFRPTMPSDPFASVCYVEVSSEHVDASLTEEPESTTNIYCTRSKDLIVNNCVVEMAYNPEKDEGWRWEPIRVRWDKTERYLRGNVGALNNDGTADNNWYSIHYPVTEDIIRTGVISEKAMEESVRAAAYYSKRGVKRDNYAIRGLTSFHNETIKSELLQKTLKKGQALLDLSCGRGGDLWKWFNIGPSWVMGTDTNIECLNTPKNGAYGRYLDLKIKQKGAVPPIVFVQAASTSSLREGVAGVSEMDRHILNVLYNNPGSSGVPPGVERLRGMAAKQFDVISCMFALHYYFDSKSSVDGFLMNIADNLKVGGYFTGCCFDGDSVFKLLAELPPGGVKYGRDGQKDIWSIKRNYETGKEDILPPNDVGLGHAIDVYFMSIGEEHREYLVSWDYLVNCMNMIGCELLQPDEIARMGLKSSSEKFSESYKPVMGKYPMSKALQEYSFLNRWFIFKRRSAGTFVPTSKAALVVEADVPPPPLQGFVASEPEPVAEPGPEPMLAPGPEPMLAPGPEPMLAPGPFTGKRPIFKFTYNSALKDDVGIGRKDWARYISTFAKSNLQDINDPAIVYPSLEAAFASERFKIGTKSPQLGAKLFGYEGNLHQKYLKEPITSEERKYELLEDEGKEIRDMIVPTYIKKTLGAKWDETAWLGKRDEVMMAYIKQRYEKDPDFRAILDAIKEKGGILVHYNGPRPSEMGGIVKGDVIEGENKLGKMYMAVAGFT
jgi:hypothetical protein